MYTEIAGERNNTVLYRNREMYQMQKNGTGMVVSVNRTEHSRPGGQPQCTCHHIGIERRHSAEGLWGQPPQNRYLHSSLHHLPWQCNEHKQGIRDRQKREYQWQQWQQVVTARMRQQWNTGQWTTVSNRSLRERNRVGHFIITTGESNKEW